MASGYTATLPADVLLDSGVLYVGSQIWGASVGGLKFSPTREIRNIPFDGKRSDLAGVDRVVSYGATLTGNMIEFGPNQIPMLMNNVAATGGPLPGAPLVYTPRRASSFLSATNYLTDVYVYFDRSTGGKARIHFKRAKVTTYTIEGADIGEAIIGIEIVAANLIGLDGIDTDDAPYLIELSSSGSFSVSVPFTLADYRTTVGDSHLLGHYNAAVNVALVGGKADTWDDERGTSGFGPQFTCPVPAWRPTLIGSAGVPGVRVRTDANAFMTTAQVARLAGLAGAKGVLIYGRTGENANAAGCYFGWFTPGNTSMISGVFQNKTADTITNPGFVLSFDPNLQSGGRLWGSENTKTRIYQWSKDAGTSLTMRHYPAPPLVNGAIPTMSGDSSTTSAFCLGGNAGTGPSGDTIMEWQVFSLLDREPTAADVTAFAKLMGNPAYSGASLPTKLVVIEGDSIAATGYDGKRSVWGTQLDRDPALAAWLVSNTAEGGDQVTVEIAARGAAVDAILADPVFAGLTKKICIIWAGTNDISNASKSAATTFAGLQAWGTARKAAGYYVIVMTPCSRGPSMTSLSGELLAYRNLIMTTPNGSWCDAKIDVIAEMPALGDASNTTTFPDNTHPGLSSQPTISNFVKPYVLAA